MPGGSQLHRKCIWFMPIKKSSVWTPSQNYVLLWQIFLLQNSTIFIIFIPVLQFVSLSFFTEGCNLLLLSSWWNSALLYSVDVCLPLWTLALAQTFAGTIGLNLVLLTYCYYRGNSHWMQNTFLKYDKTFLPGEDFCENIPIVWKEGICF